jgi:hypothetical protein
MFLTPKVIIFETRRTPKVDTSLYRNLNIDSPYYESIVPSSIPKWFTKSLEYWFTIYINQTHYSYGMNELIWNKALFENGGTL